MKNNPHILEQEARLLIAIETNDVVELDRLSNKELLFTDQYGRLITKARELESHRSGTLIIDILRVKEYQISLINDVAVITSVTYLTGKHREVFVDDLLMDDRPYK